MDPVLGEREEEELRSYPEMTAEERVGFGEELILCISCIIVTAA